MAGGGLMQLVAYGAQDLYLTHEPQITFFKVVYRRHTNFAVESIEQTVSGSQKFNGKCTINVSRNGDLINNVLVEVDLPQESSTSGTGTVFHKHFGYALLKEVAVYIGGQEIDRQYSHWMSVWSDLTHSKEQKDCLAKLVDHDSSANGTQPTETVMVPLQFWFCRDNGLALPLIALQYHEVKLELVLATADENGVGNGMSGTSISAVRCWCDYVFLDTEERRKFAQTRHEYLIEQVQKQTEATTGTETTTKAKLEFNHPVKELVWFIPQKAHDYSSTTVNFNSYADKWLDEAVLKLNNTDRFKTRKAQYFNYVQPYQHHTGCPKPGCYVYSFALNPEKHQPSGTCNFSRIDSAILNMKRTAYPVSSNEFQGSVHIYATNYNVLRIMSGMGGLAYSN